MNKICAFVVTYNGQRFLRGRLEDLFAQTAYAAGDLSVLVVNAGSTDDSRRILWEYLDRPHFHLLTTPRYGIYTGWNDAIQYAIGAQYVVNANVDDRLFPDAYAVMSDVLDKHDDLDVVWGDSFVTATPNATYKTFVPTSVPPYTTGMLPQIPYSPEALLTHCLPGQTPMWRRSLHEQHGWFDESYLLAGDYEMWLRLAANDVDMAHIPRTTGLYYHADNATAVNQQQSDYEARRARLKWRQQIAQVHTRPDDP